MGLFGGFLEKFKQGLAKTKEVFTAPLKKIFSAFSIGRMQLPYVAMAVLAGGNVRVGLEDNLYLPGGTMAKSNGELVEVAARMVRDVGREPATVEQARRILGLGSAT